MSLQPINSPTTWKRAQTSINANFTALVNALAGEGTVDATDPAVTALLTDNGSGAYAAVEGIVEDVADGVVEGLVTGSSDTRAALAARYVTQGSIVLNVRDFGAVGGGVTNDNGAFQAAINAAEDKGGGIVYVPAGSYRVTGLTLPSKTILQGSG